jgi:hypothetical protein
MHVAKDVGNIALWMATAFVIGMIITRAVIQPQNPANLEQISRLIINILLICVMVYRIRKDEPNRLYTPLFGVVIGISLIEIARWFNKYDLL